MRTAGLRAGRGAENCRNGLKSAFELLRISIYLKEESPRELGGIVLIDIKGLRLAFGEKVVFDDVGCLIGERARMGLVGNNGAGKTTLLRVLMGEIEPDGGRVERSRGLKVGYLPQDLVELEPVPVLDLLKERVGLAGLEARLRETELALSRTDEGDRGLGGLLDEHSRLERHFEHLGGFGFEAAALKVLRGLGFAQEDGARNCSEFSGGWKMRIAMAALLLSVPDVLLLDEPTNHLDVYYQLEILDLIRSAGVSCLVVMHDLNLAAQHCDRLYVMHDGRVVAGGRPRDVLTPELIRRVYRVEGEVTTAPDGAPHVLFLRTIKP